MNPNPNPTLTLALARVSGCGVLGEWVCERYPSLKHNPNAGSSAGVRGVGEKGYSNSNLTLTLTLTRTKWGDAGCWGDGVLEPSPKPKTKPMANAGSSAGVQGVGE